jgi:hypothetical protein
MPEIQAQIDKATADELGTASPQPK